MQFTLRQLEVFLAVAKTGNLTKAAHQLKMSQSAASSSLKDLESQFNLLLFDRIGKRLQLNQKGHQLRFRADNLMAQALELEQSLMNAVEITEIKVGATLTIANFLALELVSQYLRKYNEAPISLEINNTEHIVEQVLNYELDIGMIEGETHHPQLTIIPWRDDQLNLFCSPEHPFAKILKINDLDLLKAKWILREPGSGTRQTFNRAMHGLIPKIKILLELKETEAIKRAVKQNIGIGCLSEISLREEFERGDLVRIETSDRDFSRKLYLILHKQKHISSSLKNWIDLCEKLHSKSS
tara:strand:- start:943 stop:1836 length:894 start_codon:yes stop_codon:yes gene_type:complete